MEILGWLFLLGISIIMSTSSYALFLLSFSYAKKKINAFLLCIFLISILLYLWYLVFSEAPFSIILNKTL